MQIRLVEIIGWRHAVAAENLRRRPAPVLGVTVEEAQIAALVVTVRREIGPVGFATVAGWYGRVPNGKQAVVDGFLMFVNEGNQRGKGIAREGGEPVPVLLAREILVPNHSISRFPPYRAGPAGQSVSAESKEPALASYGRFIRRTVIDRSLTDIPKHDARLDVGGVGVSLSIAKDPRALEALLHSTRAVDKVGRKAIFVNPQFTLAIEGMKPAESRAILDVLCAQAQVPADGVSGRKSSP